VKCQIELHPPWTPEQLLPDRQVGIAELEGQVGGDVAHQRIAQLGAVVAQLDQLVAGDDQQVGPFRSAAGRGGAQPLVDERDLTEGVPPPEGGDDERAGRLGGAGGLDHGRADLDVHLSVGDDVQFVAGAVLLKDDLALLGLDLGADGGDHLQLGRGQIVEDVGLAQDVEVSSGPAYALEHGCPPRGGILPRFPSVEQCLARDSPETGPRSDACEQRFT
jgi:hypothetical protein